MKVIGLIGRKRSGKDTVATMIKDMFVNDESYEVNILHFADILKHDCETYLKLPKEYFYDDKDTERDIKVTQKNMAKLFGVYSADTEGMRTKFTSGRDILQYIGTDVARSKDKDIWVNRISLSSNPDPKIHVINIIADVRFENECEYVMKLGGHIIHVERDIKCETDSHLSESLSWVAKFENTIIPMDNNGTLSDLNSTVFKLMEALKC